MRILFTDEQNTLTCIKTTQISYDTSRKTLWFTDDDGTWETKMNQTSAENKIRDAFNSGTLDLSYHDFTYEEFKYED